MPAEVTYSEVEAGIAWLDERDPDWAAKIDLDSLYLGDPCCCVICHVTGMTYGDAKRSLGITGDASSELGFEPNKEIRDKYNLYFRVEWYQNAEDQWRQAIADRLPPA